MTNHHTLNGLLQDRVMSVSVGLKSADVAGSSAQGVGKAALLVPGDSGEDFSSTVSGDPLDCPQVP